MQMARRQQFQKPDAAGQHFDAPNASSTALFARGHNGRRHHGKRETTRETNTHQPELLMKDQSHNLRARCRERRGDRARSSGSRGAT